MYSKLILSLLFVAPFTAHAQNYELIAPIGSLSGSVDLKTYLNGIFETTIGIAGILAVFMLVWCGIKLMGTGSVSGKSEAKQCIWNAIFGLLLAVGSWIILNTINPLLLKNDAQITVTTPQGPGAAPVPPGDDPMPTQPGWYFRYKDADGKTKNSQRFDSDAGCIAVKDPQKQSNPGSIVLTNNQECFQVFEPSGTPSGNETQTRQQICGNDSCVSNSSTNVYINHGPCVGGQTKGCTNVASLRSDAVDIAKSLQGSCGCRVTITGGTEGGHKSHGPGLPMMDLAKTTQVDAVVKSDPSTQRPSFSGYREWYWNNWWFTDEGDHWHICPSGYNSDYCRPPK